MKHPLHLLTLKLLELDYKSPVQSRPCCRPANLLSLPQPTVVGGGVPDARTGRQPHDVIGCRGRKHPVLRVLPIFVHRFFSVLPDYLEHVVILS